MGSTSYDKVAWQAAVRILGCARLAWLPALCLLHLIRALRICLRAWPQMGIFYFVSPRVTRSLVYGLAARNRLDLYRPPAKSKRPPDGYRVVIYITGEESCPYPLTLCER